MNEGESCQSTKISSFSRKHGLPIHALERQLCPPSALCDMSRKTAHATPQIQYPALDSASALSKSSFSNAFASDPCASSGIERVLCIASPTTTCMATSTAKTAKVADLAIACPTVGRERAKVRDACAKALRATMRGTK